MGQTRTDSSPDERPPQGLSRQRIIDTAIELFAREGDEALSMRRIAQELDFWPMSLYRYFQDKEALLDALGEAAAAEIVLPRARLSWRRQLRELMLQITSLLRHHPGGARLRLSGQALPPASARVADGAVGILVAAGFAPDEAERAWQALVEYATGAAVSGSDQFDYGLELMLDGVELRAGAASTRKRRAAG